jgi:D-alanyl-D-alanine carboxypeptidase/D-alanyl-D-alanine-endopeptidase (penicillin-binding protein 4)
MVFLIFIAVGFHCSNTMAEVDCAKIAAIIAESGQEDRATISISVKDIDTGKSVFSRDEKKLLHPASTLKVFTLAAAIGTIGEDYEFVTEVLECQDNLYVKMSADPLLTTSDLVALIRDVKKRVDSPKTVRINIDDSVIDKVPYPDGWCIDDMCPYAKKLSPYVLNRNTTAVEMRISESGNCVEICQSNPYKHALRNEVVVGDKNNVDVVCYDGEHSHIFSLRGTVASNFAISIPVFNPVGNFVDNFMKILEQEQFKYQRKLYTCPVPQSARPIVKISHKLKQMYPAILHNSDNFVTEIVFKVAGGKVKGGQFPGSTQAGVDMFKAFYKKIAVGTSTIRIVDGSGLSRYNVLSTDWETDALVALAKCSTIRQYMCKPVMGTLSLRLKSIPCEVLAKTGSLRGIACLCGYITPKSGRTYAFSIIINNFDCSRKVAIDLIDKLVVEFANLD